MSARAQEPFARRTVVWLGVLVGGSFLAGLVLMGFAEELGAPRSAGTDVFSKSALGYHAWEALLERCGFEVRVRRMARVGGLEPGVPVVALEPDMTEHGRAFRLAERERDGDDEGAADEPTSSDGDGAALDRDHPFAVLLESAARAQAPLAVVLPRWSGQANPNRPTWLARVREDRDDAARCLAALNSRRASSFALSSTTAPVGTSFRSSWGEAYVVEIERCWLLEEDAALEPLVWCDAGVLAARVRDPQGPASLVVAEPGLFHTAGLGRGDHARLAVRLFEEFAPGRRLVVDEAVHGFGLEPGIMAQLVHFPLVLALGHVVLVLALLLWAGAVRFGAPRPAPSALGDGKQILIDNTAKLLLLSGNPAHALPAYYKGCVLDVARYYHLPRGLPWSELVERLEEIARARDLELNLNAEWKHVRELYDSRRVRREAAVSLARRLHHWREGMLHVDRANR
ncbi:MAG: hypothetical protein H6828_01115 [Planctomycetes bacterium]|nr:hypothetical protein [Planctomycetota bacterium]